MVIDFLIENATQVLSWLPRLSILFALESVFVNPIESRSMHRVEFAAPWISINFSKLF